MSLFNIQEKISPKIDGEFCFLAGNLIKNYTGSYFLRSDDFEKRMIHKEGIANIHT